MKKKSEKIKVNLKENVFIEGFDKKINLSLRCDLYFEDTHDIIYRGKTSEIPENIAKKCVDEINGKHGYIDSGYKDYLSTNGIFVSAKQSIQSVCPKKFCIIYTTK